MRCSEPSRPGTAELVAMTLADGRFPSGGYAQSGGLEAAVAAGLTAGQVPDFVRGRLRTVTLVDAATAVVARARCRAGDASGLVEVEQAWAARTPSQVWREAARLTGRGHLRVASHVWPEVGRLLAGHAPLSRPVVLGTVAAVAGLDAAGLARLVAYDDVQGVASAAPKLLPLDPATVVAWVVSLHEEVEGLAHAVSGLTDPQQIPDPGSPALDELADAHRRAGRRLFHV